MKRLLILALMFLTSCSSVLPTTPASYFDLTPAPADLSMDSTPEQIQRAMYESAARWTTLQMNGTVTWYLPDGTTQVFQEAVWLDPLNNRYRVELNGVLNSTDKFLKFSDGTNIYNVNLNIGHIESFPYPDFARVGQYVPPMWKERHTPARSGGRSVRRSPNLPFHRTMPKTKGLSPPSAWKQLPDVKP
jgi:hypothetical protein